MARRLSLIFVLILVAVIAGGCASKPLRRFTPVRVDETTPTVGDTVPIASGAVTFESVTTSAPPESLKEQGVKEHVLWLHFKFVNTTQETVTVHGYRGPPVPSVTAVDGSTMLLTGKQASFQGGVGGWGPGHPEEVSLAPGGYLVAAFGILPSFAQYVPGRLPLTVSWRPTSGEAAVFLVK